MIRDPNNLEEKKLNSGIGPPLPIIETPTLFSGERRSFDASLSSNYFKDRVSSSRFMNESSELSLQDEEIPAMFNSANLLISSILPLAFILIICLCSSDFIQSRLSKTFSKSSKWGFLFQEFISQDDIDELNRQHDKGRQSRNQVANQTLQAANSDLSNDDLDSESSPLLGRNKNEGSRVGSSISDARPSGETTLALIAVPVVQLAAWTLVMAYQLVDSRGNVLFYTAIAALLSWVSQEHEKTEKVGNLAGIGLDFCPGISK